MRFAGTSIGRATVTTHDFVCRSYCLGLILGGVVAGLRGTAIEWGQALKISLAANVTVLSFALAWYGWWLDWTNDQFIESGILPFIFGIAINSVVPALLFIVGDRMCQAGREA